MSYDLIPINPIKDSIEHLMAITFAKSTSPSYPLAVSVAQGAFKYTQTQLGKQIIHIALLSKTKEDVNRGLSLFKYLQGLKTFQVFCKGRLIEDYYRINHVLQCYLTACDCNDYKAHCHQVIDNPFSESKRSNLSLTIHLSLDQPKPAKPITIDQYIFPCNYIYSYFKFQCGHPSTIEDQIQAMAVKEQCDWCPKFNSSDFNKIHTKIIMPDGNVIYQKSEQ